MKEPVSVRLVNIWKRFKDTTVVSGIDLNVQPGEFVCLLGPSGCGKTTTLRILAGLEFPTRGRVFIGDRDVTDLPPKDRDISMVFQSYALFPHMRVWENIAFGLKLRGAKREEIDEKVAWAAKLLGLEKQLENYPSQLSGGQRQRVAIGRAIVREPSVLLFDEPLSNLDAKLRVKMRAELKKLQKKLRVTTVYVTHDQIEAMTMADRIAVMYGGVIQQYGTPDEVYYTPKNKFVAGFIGTPPMNFIEGHLTIKGGPIFECADFSYPLSGYTFNNGYEKETDTVTLGIRPEDIRLGETGELKGIVDVTEPIGSHVYLHVLVGKETTLVVTAPANIPYKVGSKVAISFDKNRLHLFGKNEIRL
ncbi:MAG: ABC transporter ATP-binding protein [Candidatus Korarchaeota archaeon]